MPLVVIGTLLLLAKLAEFGPTANWSWWVVLAPFAGAILWWQFADSTGWTQRRAIDKMERRKAERREKAMDALGIDRRREKQIIRATRDKARNTTTVDPTQRDYSVGDSPPTPPPPEPERREPRL
jgi:small Trp-rich protein